MKAYKPKSTIFQFETYPDRLAADGKVRWESKILIDLDCVNAAKMHAFETTDILLAICPQWIEINVPYEKFAELLKNAGRIDSK